jgi:hypothetical protein
MADLDVWMYASRSCLTETIDSAIDGIVCSSRLRNAENHVTGMLLFTGSRFVQFVEGPAAAVKNLRASIIADPRHDDLCQLVPEPSPERRFAGWSLGYSGPSRYVQSAVDQAIIASDQRRFGKTADLLRLMIEFAS